MSHNATTYPAGPIEAKVTAATIASAAITFLVNALTNGVSDADSGVLLTALPDWAEPFILALVAAAPTFLAGWAAKHTHRPDLRQGPLVPPVDPIV
jgi:hypothetical protein